MPSTGPSTLQDVADLSGVSRGTASRALTGGGRVSAGDEIRVLEAAEASATRPTAVHATFDGRGQVLSASGCPVA